MFGTSTFFRWTSPAASPSPPPDAVVGLLIATCAGDSDRLARLVSRRVPLEQFAEAFEACDGDVKVVLDLQ